MSPKALHALRRQSHYYGNVPIDTLLNLAEVVVRYRVTLGEMAAAAGISRTACHRLQTNDWPIRRSREEIERGLRDLLAKRGATAEELATLFEAAPTPTAWRAQDGRTCGPGRRRAPPPLSLEEENMLLSKHTLSPAARRAFKLFTNPFDGEVTTDAAMYLGDDFAYCREAIWQTAKLGSFVALVGESGAGKTTLVQDLEARLLAEPERVIVIRPGVLGMEGNDRTGKSLKSSDILHAIITTLKPSATVPQTLQARTVMAGKLLTGSAQVGTAHLLVVEEAHSMPDATLKHLKRLHEMRLGRRPLLGILLVAQPELKSTLAAGLADGSLREVAQRCEIVELLPLDRDLRAYLEQRANACNASLDALFDADAIEALRMRLTVRRNAGRDAISICYPLAVNNLVTKALNAAAEVGAERVTRDIVARC